MIDMQHHAKLGASNSPPFLRKQDKRKSAQNAPRAVPKGRAKRVIQ